MDGIENVALQQQSKVNTKAQGRATHQVKQPKQESIVKELQKEVSSTKTEINSKEQVQDLVNQLNNAMAPMNTNLKFGVDSQDIFFVSVIEEETSRIIRRFPAEQAQDFLPKMKEVIGILFDLKG
ncbi:flagellar protein FlaG [Sulfurimonas sp.]|uniref:flagellar protein FlaG n=1 Tax=Sulfurimonas sp. TaxID=2022749 RepID=UPI002B4A4B01|nr:flagellar protein FlaG [Sulfurimonas sp.]